MPEGMKEGIAEAIDESMFLDDEVNPADAEYDDESPAAEAEEPVGQEAESENTANQATEETDPETEAQAEAQEDVPEEYWGIRLEDLSAEQRAEVIKGLEQRDSTINKLQQQLAEVRKAESEAAPAEAEEAEEVDDDTLLRAAGYDPETFYDPAQKAPVIATLRRQLALEEQVEALSESRQVETTERVWNNELDALEAEHGKLPFDRDDVIRLAVSEGYPTPFETYFRIMGPAQREVSTAVAALRRDADKRVASGGPKPRNVGARPAPIDPKMPLRDAVAAAAKEAQRETGLRWRDAGKGLLRKPKE